MKTAECQIYGEREISLADVNLPAGLWLLVDDDSFVRVSGENLLAVNDAGIKMGLARALLERTPTEEDKAFACGQGVLSRMIK